MPRDGDIPVTTTEDFGQLKGRMTQAICAADDLTPAWKVICCVLVGMASSTNGKWRAGASNLARRTGLHERTVRAGLYSEAVRSWFQIDYSNGRAAVFRPRWERAKPIGWSPNRANTSGETSEVTSGDFSEDRANTSGETSEVTSGDFSETSDNHRTDLGHSLHRPRANHPRDKDSIHPQYEEDTVNARATLGDKALLDEAVEAWNVMAAANGLPQVQKLTDARRAAVRARLKDLGGIAGWDVLLSKVAASAFLKGEKGDRDWKADFDFVTKESKCTKIMEGAFDGPPKCNGGSTSDRLNRAFDRLMGEPESPI